MRRRKCEGLGRRRESIVIARSRGDDGVPVGGMDFW